MQRDLAGIQALYHPNRNKYPLLRVGERGSGRWRRISWDEALTRVAEKAMETREKYGAEALFCTTGGGGNPEIWSIAVSVMYSERRTGMSRAARSVICRVCCPVP